MAASNHIDATQQPEPGDPMYPSSAPVEEVKIRRQRHFGITARSARVEEWKYLKKLEIARATPGLSQKDLAELVEKAFEATKSERHSDVPLWPGLTTIRPMSLERPSMSPCTTSCATRTPTSWSQPTSI